MVHVGGIALAVLDVDVVGGKVDLRELEVLRRRIGGVGDQSARIGLVGEVTQLVQEPFDFRRAVPPNDRGRYLVPDDNPKQCWVAAERSDATSDRVLDLQPGRATIEERDVLCPGYASHDPQPVLGSAVEQPAWRRAV